MAHLIIYLPTGNKKVELFDNNTIGRTTPNRIQIPDRSISKQHALISIDRYHKCTIQDCASTNGTYVNKRKIEKKMTLLDGDEIMLGNIHCLFKGEPGFAIQMVQIQEDEEENLNNTTIYPPHIARFLPENIITDDKDLRADYEKLRVTYELQRDISLDTNINHILDKILDRTSEFLKYDQGVILLAEEGSQLTPHSYKAWGDEEKFTVSSTLVRYVQEKKCGVISSDILSDDRFNEADSIVLQGIKSTIAVPILSKNELLGVMILSSLETTDAFTEKDLYLLTNIANQAAQILKNSLLHDELRLSFESSIRTLSAMVDARHPLTAGHSERVTEYSIYIAKEMKISKYDLENLKFAALLHDIGKIGIRDEVLLKNGQFTPEEKDIMDTHPIKTREILKTFRFPATLKNVPEIASHHHEKINGEGYPEALTGPVLPLISKIIAVADVFDALTAKRDYPKYTPGKKAGLNPLPLPEVIAIIESEADTHFDCDVVKAFKQCLPKILSHFRGIHFPPEYIDDTINDLLNTEEGSLNLGQTGAIDHGEPGTP